jgi:two-component system NtrC family sensor kinase
VAQGDPDQLHQIVTNLVVNAQQELAQLPPPRLIRIGVSQRAETVLVQVADNGPGVPEAIRGRIFDPFFTTKPVGAGTGVGLAVSRGIAEAYGGSLNLVDHPGVGACFELQLRAVPL